MKQLINWVGILTSAFLVTVLVLNFTTKKQDYYTSLIEVGLSPYESTPNKPHYKVSVSSEFGNSVCRISDANEFGVNGQQLKHNYSTDQCFNADNSLIKLSGYPAAILDANTLEFLYWADIPSYGRWSNKNPNLIYGTSDNKFVSYNVKTEETNVLLEYPEPLDFGYGEGNLDYNDKVVALITPTQILTYSLEHNFLISVLPRIEGDLDWVSVTPNGNYVLMSWRTDGDGPNEGLKRYNIDLTNEIHLSDYTEHGAMGISEHGDEIYLQFGNIQTHSNDNYLELIYIQSGVVEQKFHWNYHNTTGIWGGHISIPNNKRGVAWITEGCCRQHPVFANEIFEYNINGNSVRQITKTHSTNSARASVNRNGTKAIYTSDYLTGNYEAYQVEVKFKKQINENNVFTIGNIISIFL